MAPSKHLPSLVLGLDYGTDSVRALLVDTKDGREVATAVAPYRLWKQGKFCNPEIQQFRQHPQDYLDALVQAVRGCLSAAPKGSAERVAAIGIDTTGSTPVAVNAEGTPLALTKEFANDPDAMFILWKDHTAIEEAEEINALAHSGRFPDYTKYSGGVYSSEWFWAKILHVMRKNPKVAKAAASWVEHCDWIAAELVGMTDPSQILRSRCAAGHKAMWHAEWGGLPPQDFLTALDKRLTGIRDRLYTETHTADKAVGRLSSSWAKRLGLPEGIPIAAGAFDAHLGAVGAGSGPGVLVKVMGTSTCDMIVVSPKVLGDRLIRGICGQVDGSIVPGLIGLEAGQSAFGDVYGWFRRVIQWPIEHVLRPLRSLPKEQRTSLIEEVEGEILPALTAAAEKIPIGATGAVAIDWFNGRRTPNANQRLRGAIAGLHLGSSAPVLFRALVEATAFGAKAIIDCFVEQGVEIKNVVAVGGIARKNPFVMQVCADVWNRRIAVVESDQCCALGAAICGATAAGIYPNIPAAQKAMAAKIEHEYRPIPKNVRAYEPLYAAYQRLGAYMESEIMRTPHSS